MTTCRECGAIRNYGENDSRPGAVSSPSAAHAAVRRLLEHAKQEKLVVIYLDAQNRMLGKPVVVSVGSLNTTRTLPRELMLPAVERSALGFIMAHNHPSGSIEPSRDDIEFTKGIVKAGQLMGVALYDHLIVSRRGFTSLKQRGLI